MSFPGDLSPWVVGREREKIAEMVKCLFWRSWKPDVGGVAVDDREGRRKGDRELRRGGSGDSRRGMEDRRRERGGGEDDMDENDNERRIV